MRALALSLAAAAALVVVTAGAASAQRDPFEPLIRPNVSGGDGTTTEPGEPEEPAGRIVAPPASEEMAATGADARSWSAIAFALIAVGTGTLALGRILRTSPAG